MSKEALEGSIKKWKRIVEDRRAVDNGYRNCKLCLMYDCGPESCTGCPVKDKTGKVLCTGTPHQRWEDHMGDHGIYLNPFRRQKDCPTCLSLAKEELAFLESLRSQYET